MKEFFQVRRSPHQRPSRNTWETEEAHTTKEIHGAFSPTQAAGRRSKPVTPDIYLKQFRQSQTSSHFFSRLKNPVYFHFLKSLKIQIKGLASR